ncbi:MAG: ribose-phosphate pyrophosphokinase [Myxococcota bacterium]|jgi:ribose-phosphate pyrophosphokinase|nr:ribose-phosphate pyrophosphokinase [Myxococcota bacterium]
MRLERMKIFAGSSHPELATAICSELGEPLGRLTNVRFSNENMLLQVDENVRGCDVFVIQTATAPLHDHIMELFILIDALKHASAARVTAVLPYMPYVRSDKKDRPRISITARLMADLIETSGADRVLTVDLHSPQIQGFFRIPADHFLGAPIICDYLSRLDLSNTVLVAPDAGEVKDLIRFANALRLPMSIIDKRRTGDDENALATNIIGDVRGKTAILIDDEIASGGTVVHSAELLHQHGARRVLAACTHAVFSGQASRRLHEAPLEEVIVTDTVPVLGEKCFPKLTKLSVAPLLARAIQAIHHGDSVSKLFANVMNPNIR